jgi:NAD(P)H dehydrogenase (quinone)
MRVLVVYAHPNPRSFCHAVLERVTAGLDDGGHPHEVIDLHAVGFDPVFRERDYRQFMHETLPDELIEQADVKRTVVEQAGGRVRSSIARRWVRGKTDREIVAALGRRTPKDVRRHQEKVARAEGLIFIAPVYWMGLPAILKGWFERVFAYGFAYTLDEDGWKGDLEGRVPLLTQQKGLVITPTFFTEEEYDKGWRQAMDTIICDWGLSMAGVKEAEHVYFHAVSAVDDATRAGYLDVAYGLGRDFSAPGDRAADTSGRIP